MSSIAGWALPDYDIAILIESRLIYE